MFHKSWVRNSVAFAAVLILIAISTLFYLNAVSVANHRRIEDYRQQVGANSAAELWAKSIEQRDPRLFGLHDAGFLSSVQYIQDQVEEDAFSITTTQLQELLSILRNSQGVQVPEIVDLSTPVLVNFSLLRSVIVECCQSQEESTGTEAGTATKEQQERWLIGVELAESLTAGGFIIDELIRFALLKTLLERGLSLIESDDLVFLENSAATLSRISSPEDGIARALQIETLVVMELEEWQASPFTSSLDLRWYLDQQIPLSLDPTTETLQALSVEEPPVYALLSSVVLPQIDSIIEKSNQMSARLLAVRCAFEATAARLRGVEWTPPTGVELLPSAAGGAARIHVSGSSVATDVYLPK
ncbi:MAG: hypothetical protein OSB12_06350 [Planctomycetota bacterium]|nr:hypothetical protein [Planctomycetota bacterium]